MKPDLDKIMIQPIGRREMVTFRQWLQTQPEAWRAIETEALSECLKRGWKVSVPNIQMIAREIDAERNPKGW